MYGPETVSSMMSLSCGGLSRSAVSAPETVFATTRRAAESATVISPDTVSSTISPAHPSASIGPDTTIARIRPSTPSRATRPLVHSTDRSPCTADATTDPDATRSTTAVWYGTATDTSTLTLLVPRSHHQIGVSTPGQVFGRSCSTRSLPSATDTRTGTSPTAPTSTRGGLSVPTTLSRPPSRETSRCVTSPSMSNRRGSVIVQLAMRRG
jgi:hypothetical protein